MRPGDRKLAEMLGAGLRLHEETHPLPGIAAAAARDTFTEQLVESIRRIRYIQTVKNQDISSLRAKPTSNVFHPIKAAMYMQAHANLEEAFWLTFLSVHFGRNARTGWRLMRDVYGGLGEVTWDWPTTSADPKAFRVWLAEHTRRLQGGDGIPRHFGNHRKYQSLDAWKKNGTGAAVDTYVNWVAPKGSQQALFNISLQANGQDPTSAFDHLYKTMRVSSFGRTAKFDFLTMVGKIGLAAIEPGSTYMGGATGPLDGARLLYGGSRNASLEPVQLEAWLMELGSCLNVGMQVLEDSLCNWQKHPEAFVRFRG